MTVSNRYLQVQCIRSPDGYHKVSVIRAIAYMGEQYSPYDEEFDGNDFSGTHLLASLADEPVGAIRIRYFGGFAKPERLVVLPKYRRTRIRSDDPRARLIADALVYEAIEHCRRKGFSYIYGHSQERLVSFWSKFGFEVIDPEPFVYGDHRYFAMGGEIPPHEDVLNLETLDHLQMVRPEGAWDQESVFDISTSRPATCPHDGLAAAHLRHVVAPVGQAPQQYLAE